jgi:hypothetical protein
MKALISLVFVALIPSHLVAGANAYQCAIREHLTQDTAGGLSRPPKPYLIGQRFAIDRNSGRFTGPEIGFGFADSIYQVLARGNNDNSFVATISTKAAKNGLHFAVVRVEEFSLGASKPFVVADGGTVASGVCE